MTELIFPGIDIFIHYNTATTLGSTIYSNHVNVGVTITSCMYSVVYYLVRHLLLLMSRHAVL